MPLFVLKVYTFKTSTENIHCLVFHLDHSGENIKGRLRAASNPPRRERETHLNASEEGETQQDTNMTEEMDTEEEVRYFFMII